MSLHAGTPRQLAPRTRVNEPVSIHAPQVREHFGIGDSLESSQLVTRSVQGKAIFMLAPPLVSLLRSDATVKFKLVNAGVRILERADHAGHFGFRLARRGFADPSTRRTLPLTTVGARATPAPSPAPPIALACSDGPGRPTRCGTRRRRALRSARDARDRAGHRPWRRGGMRCRALSSPLSPA